VRPELYREINNFYTTTVYEKGAEVVRMIHTLLGRSSSAKAWTSISSATTASRDRRAVRAVLRRCEQARPKQFMRWYSQAGTPEVVASGHYDARRKPTSSTSRR
jgi:aminopeptidase N